MGRPRAARTCGHRVDKRARVADLLKATVNLTRAGTIALGTTGAVRFELVVGHEETQDEPGGMIHHRWVAKIVQRRARGEVVAERILRVTTKEEPVD